MVKSVILDNNSYFNAFDASLKASIYVGNSLDIEQNMLCNEQNLN